MISWEGVVGASAAAVVTPLVLQLLSGKAALAPGTLGYRRGVRLFTVLLAFGPTLVVAGVALFQASPLKDEDRLPVLFLMTLFPALGLPMVLEVFRVKHRYDPMQIDFVSPWSAARTLEWSKVRRVRWRQIVKWLDLEGPEGSRALHVSPMLSGLPEFATLALQRIPVEVLEADPEAHAALLCMKHGYNSALLMGEKTPLAITTNLGLR